MKSAGNNAGCFGVSAISHHSCTVHEPVSSILSVETVLLTINK